MNNFAQATSEEILADFGRSRSEPIFRELVKRHLPLVYNTALRVTNGDKHLAEDVAQIVFTDLAAKSARFSGGNLVAGWLHQHTWFTASKLIRTERRRLQREQQSMDMQDPQNQTEIDPQVRPILDEALTGLKPEDRDALVLRFFERADFGRVGRLLGVSEDAAQKRVSRALEKLRGVLSARGVSISISALTAALSAEASAMPMTLAQTISAGALAGGVAASGTVAGFFATTKFKIAATGALIAGLSIPLVSQQQTISSLRHENRSLRSNASELERLRADNAQLKAQTFSPEDVQRMNREFSELQRLRGEVTLLRRQFAGGTNAPAPSEEREPVEESQAPQLLFEARIAELTHERMTELLAEGFPPVGNQRDFTLLLSPDKAEEFIRLLEQSEGVDIVSAPRVTTVDGREAAIAVTEELSLPDGKTLPLGLTLNVLGSLGTDHASVTLKVKVQMTEFLGWGNEAQTVPRMRTRQAEQQAVLHPGQTLVMGRSVSKADGDEAEAKLQIYSICSTFIDRAGNVWKSRGELRSAVE